jgi:hypothetical protein
MMQRSLLSQDEIQAYGLEALSVMERKAREVVQPFVEQVTWQNQALRQELQQVKSNDIWSMLDQRLPNWREINQDSGWKEWLTIPDVYSGLPRQQLLNQAFAAGDADRVLTFFNGFLAENAQPPVARASRMSADNSQTIITNKQIEGFYDRVRRGFYEGKEKQKMAEEAQIHRAILEGRLRRTTP